MARFDPSHAGLDAAGAGPARQPRAARADEDALEAVLERARRQLVYAYMRADAVAWPVRVRGAVAAFLAFLDDEPRVAEILFGEEPGDSSSRAASRAHVLRSLSLAIHADGARAAAAAGESHRLDQRAERMIGVAVSVVETHLLRCDPRPLIELRGTLTGLIVMAYLGPHAALAEMDREHTGADGTRHGV